MNCPKCGTENPVVSNFCKKCGGPVGQTGGAGGRTKLCPNGHRMEANLDVCPHCPKPSPQSGDVTRVAGQGLQKTVPADSADKAHDTQRTRGTTEGTEPMTSRPPASGRDQRTVIIDSESEGKRDAQPARAIVGWLVTFSHKPEGQDYRLLEGRNAIGASPECDIAIEDDAASGTHAIIMYRSGRYVIEDQLSTNGTWLNGEDTGPRGVADLSDNDNIKVGDTTFVFKCFERPTG